MNEGMRQQGSDEQYFWEGIVPDYILGASKRGFTPPSASINHIHSCYQSQFFFTQLTDWTQIVVDAFFSKTCPITE